MRAAAVAVLVGLAVLVGGAGSARRVLVPGGRYRGGLPGRRAAWQRVRRGRWRRPSASGDELAGVVGEVAAVVRAGTAPAAAWSRVEPDGPGWTAPLVGTAAAAGRSGGSVADALAACAETLPPEPGADVRALAAAWRVVELTGAPAADVLDRVAAGLREAAEVRAARRAAMAAPRATARVLVALPVLGLVLGQLVGADPLGVLVGTGTGRVALVAGALLAVGAVGWTRALVRSAGAP